MKFYQSTQSKTMFESATPDDETIGLDDLHKPEENAVKLFCKDDSDALIMGGISGTGKTYTSKRLGKALV